MTATWASSLVSMLSSLSTMCLVRGTKHVTENDCQEPYLVFENFVARQSVVGLSVSVLSTRWISGDEVVERRGTAW